MTAVILAISLLWAAGIWSPQAPQYAIRVDAPVVSLESIVVDANSRPVMDLKKEDFTILEDGEPRPIQNFSPAETPYSTLLLFQNTPTVAIYRPFLTDASNRFMKGLRAQDRLSVYAIELTTHRLMDWRNAQIGKTETIRVGQPSGELDLYDALDQVLDKFSGETARKAIIVMSTGRDSRIYRDTVTRGRVPLASEDAEFQKLLQKVRIKAIPLYFVAVSTDRNLLSEEVMVLPTQFTGLASPPSQLMASAEYQFLKKSFPYTSAYKKLKDPSPTLAEDFLAEIRSRMELLAEVSGGRIYFPKDLDEVNPLYEQIARELGTSYSFGYPPRNSNPGATHHIEVRVPNPKLRVIQSRDSYTTR
jgi:VWFA-related protein